MRWILLCVKWRDQNVRECSFKGRLNIFSQCFLIIKLHKFVESQRQSRSSLVNLGRTNDTSPYIFCLQRLDNSFDEIIDLLSIALWPLMDMVYLFCEVFDEVNRCITKSLWSIYKSTTGPWELLATVRRRTVHLAHSRSQLFSKRTFSLPKWKWGWPHTQWILDGHVLPSLTSVVRFIHFPY